MPRRSTLWACALLLLAHAAPLLAAGRPQKEVFDARLLPNQLTADTFDASLKALPAGRAVIMEFYASWCPACQHFQPAYERVAAYFHAAPPPKPEVYVARVDCATQARCTRRAGGLHHCGAVGLPIADSRAVQRTALRAKELSSKPGFKPCGLGQARCVSAYTVF